MTLVRQRRAGLTCKLRGLRSECFTKLDLFVNSLVKERGTQVLRHPRHKDWVEVQRTIFKYSLRGEHLIALNICVLVCELTNPQK